MVKKYRGSLFDFAQSDIHVTFKIYFGYAKNLQLLPAKKSHNARGVMAFLYLVKTVYCILKLIGKLK